MAPISSVAVKYLESLLTLRDSSSGFEFEEVDEVANPN